MIRALTMMLVALLVGCTNEEKKPAPIDASPIQLTAEEQKYVKEHRVVTWVVENNRPPFVFVENEVVKGISPKYLSLISQKTGLIFKPTPVQSFLKGVDAVRAGEIDLITAVRPSADRTSYFGFTSPYAYHAGVFLIRINNQPSSPLRAGICQGDAANYYVSMRFPEMKIIMTGDNEEAVSLLEKGLVDVAIMDEASADFLSHKSIIKMRKVNTDFDYPYSFAFKKENEVLGAIISKAIASINVEDKRAINESWEDNS